ncbi:MAG: tryptophan synthase subunit alpha [Candidatus Omnitrophota bacterium]
MNRIQKKFIQLRKINKKALIVYIMAGDPSLSLTKKLVLALEENKVDLIELGVPFSDPIADGPVIQRAVVRALKNKVNVRKILTLVRQIREVSNIPLVLMLYYNLILNFGEEKFSREASKSGVDGIIVPDLPIEEAKSFIRYCKKYNIANIFFVTPTSSLRRIKMAAKKSRGFIYYIARTGVTGAKTEISKDINKQIKKIKKLTNKPVCVGFGIRSASQLKKINRIADGCIMGSALVDIISKYSKSERLITKAAEFVRRLRA